MKKALTLSRYLMLVLLVFVLQLWAVSSYGRLYFGFLEYANLDNRRFNGQCCDGVEDSSGQCPLPCDLIFQMDITGLDGSNTRHRRPSDVPFHSNGQSKLPFQTPGLDLINPLNFTFRHWPNCLHVKVQIFDADTPDTKGEEEGQGLQLVDTMTLQLALASPSYFFTARQLAGQRLFQPSSLTVAIRYECDINITTTNVNTTTCPPASLANLTTHYANVMDCPHPATSTSTSTSSTTPTTTTTTTTITTTTTTTATTTTTTATTTTTTPESTTITTTTIPTTETSTEMETTSKAFSTTTTTSTSATPTTTTTATPTPKPLRPVTKASLASFTTDVTLGPATVTSTDGGKGPMDYWGVILGAVLGALVILALIAFLVYYRRRKALIKWQEIYTVQPRLASVVEENGTAGRSDIPVETSGF